MKKFSLLEEEIKPKYEVKDSLRNEIYSILEDTLSIKISNFHIRNSKSKCS